MRCSTGTGDCAPVLRSRPERQKGRHIAARASRATSRSVDRRPRRFRGVQRTAGASVVRRHRRARSWKYRRAARRPTDEPSLSAHSICGAQVSVPSAPPSPRPPPRTPSRRRRLRRPARAPPGRALPVPPLPHEGAGRTRFEPEARSLVCLHELWYVLAQDFVLARSHVGRA